MNYSFETANSIGKKGECAINIFLTSQGMAVEDVSKKKEYQKKDIDFLVKTSDYEFSVDIKTDTKAFITGNFAVELISNTNKDFYKEGYLKTSEATYFCFFTPQDQVAYFVKVSELRELYKRKSGFFRHLYTTQNEFGNVWKQGRICLVPLSLLCRCPSFRRYKIGVDNIAIPFGHTLSEFF